MPNQFTVRRLYVLAFCLCAGCASSPGAKQSSNALASGQTAAGANSSSAVEAGGNGSNPAATDSAGPPPANGGQVNGVSGGTAKGPSPSAPDPRMLDGVLAELAELGQLEPEAQRRLIEDLRNSDPKYWSRLVQTFRASLAYRRRSAQKAAEEVQPVQRDEADAAQPEIVLTSANEPITDENRSPTTQKPALAGNPAPQTAAAIAVAGQPADTMPPQAPADSKAPQAPANIAQAVPAKAADSSDWRRHLEAAIAELEKQTRERPGDADALSKQVYLRLLDLAAGRRDDALKPIPGLAPGQQDYWAKQFFALSTYLDQSSGDPGRRAAEASLHLARAVAALGEQGPLVVRNLAFCTDVDSYGVLKRFESAEFHAGQQVLLYAEVENFKSEETAQGFHTSLEASYQILDRQGQRVAHDDLALTEEHCQNRRRDFFVRYFITLPKNLYEGVYTLDLTIEDKLGRKIGQSSIEFSVKSK